MTTFTWNPKDYEMHSSAQQIWAKELFAKLNLQGHESILDIGCGNGKITAELSSLVPNGVVVGIDSSDTMIRFATDKYPPERFLNLRFIWADARQLRFQNQFDIVFSNAALHWVDDHLSVLKGISQSLKTKGRVLLQMGGRGNIPEMLQAIEIVTSSMRWQTYFQHFSFPYHFYGLEEYQRWLEVVNLYPVRIELIPKTITYRSSEELAGWIRTTWLPYTQQVPQQWREDFIDELVACYLRLCPAQNGSIQVQVMRLEVDAWKA
ncbi:SAM-dependent methyltransferase [filamentous cyanobacterium CCP2]|nr:SAM-dependent methyltransferase [filamentous cyanobacterium CCP2]